jgi:hypothetical protein
MHAKKVYVGLKRKKQARNLGKLVDFKRKKKDCLLVFYIAIMKPNFLVFFNNKNKNKIGNLKTTLFSKILKCKSLVKNLAIQL